VPPPLRPSTTIAEGNTTHWDTEKKRLTLHFINRVWVSIFHLINYGIEKITKMSRVIRLILVKVKIHCRKNEKYPQTKIEKLKFNSAKISWKKVTVPTKIGVNLRMASRSWDQRTLMALLTSTARENARFSMTNTNVNLERDAILCTITENLVKFYKPPPNKSKKQFVQIFNKLTSFSMLPTLSSQD
jgi:hypothetical protein